MKKPTALEVSLVLTTALVVTTTGWIISARNTHAQQTKLDTTINSKSALQSRYNALKTEYDVLSENAEKLLTVHEELLSQKQSIYQPNAGRRKAESQAPVKVTFYDISYIDSNGWNSPQEGHKFLRLDLEVTNNSSSKFLCNPFCFKLTDSEHRVHGYKTSKNETLGSLDLFSGDKARGVILFELLDHVEPESLIFEYGSFPSHRLKLNF